MGFTSFTARLLGGSAVVVGISRTLMLSAFFELVPFSRPVGARTLPCLSVLLGFLLFLGLKLGIPCILFLQGYTGFCFVLFFSGKRCCVSPAWPRHQHCPLWLKAAKPESLAARNQWLSHRVPGWRVLSKAIDS